jgi:hypothetical protein
MIPGAALLGIVIAMAAGGQAQRTTHVLTGLTPDGSSTVCATPRRPHHRGYTSRCVVTVWIAEGGLCNYDLNLRITRGHLPTVVHSNLSGTTHVRRWAIRFRRKDWGCAL